MRVHYTPFHLLVTIDTNTFSLSKEVPVNESSEIEIALLDAITL